MSESSPAPEVVRFKPVEAEFLVRIEYREPSFEAATGPRDKPFVSEHRVRSTSAAGAESVAVRQFESLAFHSSVGWVRKIQRVIATKVGQ